MKHLLLVVVSLALVSEAVDKPWYHTLYEETLHSFSDFGCGNDINSKASSVCFTTSDCETGLSCFRATAKNEGCCMPALKPNQTGCIIDDQCKRACESTHCDRSQTPSRCLCDDGSHFLFNKCWKKCPEFAYPEPRVDFTGFSECVLRTDMRTALLYMRRHRRQLRSAFC